MNINNSNTAFLYFKSSADNTEKKEIAQRKSYLDNFQTKVRNSADLNDTIQVPRTIFKGYLAFMVSTTMVTLASFLKDKHKNLKTGINASAALLALYGTYSFVRPYIIKGSGANK